MTDKKTTIEKCNPNAHGWLKLVRYTHHNEVTGEDEVSYYVREPNSNDSDDVTDFDTEEEAKAFYDRAAKTWSGTRNWEAQAAYDEKWGTDNGYAPWQYGREY